MVRLRVPRRAAPRRTGEDSAGPSYPIFHTGKKRPLWLRVEFNRQRDQAPSAFIAEVSGRLTEIRRACLAFLSFYSVVLIGFEMFRVVYSVTWLGCEICHAFYSVLWIFVEICHAFYNVCVLLFVEFGHALYNVFFIFLLTGESQI